MPNAEHLTTFFEVVQVLLLAVLAVRLALTGLWRSYPVFFCYIILRIPDALAPLIISVRTILFFHIWLWKEPIFWLFHILLVAELCRLVLAGHPGIYSLGKWAMSAAVAVALTTSILTLMPQIKPHTPQISQRLQYYLAAERGVDFGLAIFLLLMLAFVSRFPFRIGRNVLIHAGLYTLYFFAETLGVFLHTLFGFDRLEALNLWMTIMACACLVAWLLLLNRQGETTKAAFPTLTKERETRILEQLDALNTTLMRAGGKK